MEPIDKKTIKFVMKDLQDLFIPSFNQAATKKVSKIIDNDIPYNKSQNRQYSVYNLIDIGKRKLPSCIYHTEQQINALQGKTIQSRVFAQSYEFYEDYQKSNLLRKKYLGHIFPKIAQNKHKFQSNLNKKLRSDAIQDIFQQFTPQKFKQTQLIKFEQSILKSGKISLEKYTTQNYSDDLQQAHYKFDQKVRQIEFERDSLFILKEMQSQYLQKKHNKESNWPLFDLKAQKRQELSEMFCTLTSDHILSGMVQVPIHRTPWPENFKIQAQLASLCSLASSRLLHKVCDDTAKLRKQRQTINYAAQIFPSRSSIYFKRIYNKEPSFEDRVSRVNRGKKEIDYQKQMPENVIKMGKSSIQNGIFRSPSNKNAKRYDNHIQIEIKPQTRVTIDPRVQIKANHFKKIPSRQINASSSSILLQNYIQQRQANPVSTQKQYAGDGQDTAKKSKRVDQKIAKRFQQQRKKVTKGSKGNSFNLKPERQTRIQYQGKNNHNRQFMKMNAVNNHKNQYFPDNSYISKKSNNIDIKKNQKFKEPQQMKGYYHSQQNHQGLNKEKLNLDLYMQANRNYHFQQNLCALNKQQTSLDFQYRQVNRKQQKSQKSFKNSTQNKFKSRQIKQRYSISFPYKVGPLVVQSQGISYLSYDLQQLDLANLAAKFLSDREKYGQNDVNLMIPQDTEENQDAKIKVFRAMDVIDYMGGSCTIKQKKYYRKFNKENATKISIAAFLLNLPLSECIKFVGVIKIQKRII